MKLMILDGNSIINRAFFGVRPLTTREGLYTHAIFGFLNIMQRLENEEAPDALCVAFDLHGPTFRHEMYDQYKATRHGMPEELAQQHITPSTIRLSVGVEHIDDIIADLEQAFEAIK